MNAVQLQHGTEVAPAPICRHCRHYHGRLIFSLDSSCAHPGNTAFNIIEGEYLVPASCQDMRSEGGKCGPSGQLFDSRPACPTCNAADSDDARPAGTVTTPSGNTYPGVVTKREGDRLTVKFYNLEIANGERPTYLVFDATTGATVRRSGYSFKSEE